MEYSKLRKSMLGITVIAGFVGLVMHHRAQEVAKGQSQINADLAANMIMLHPELCKKSEPYIEVGEPGAFYDGKFAINIDPEFAANKYRSNPVTHVEGHCYYHTFDSGRAAEVGLEKEQYKNGNLQNAMPAKRGELTKGFYKKLNYVNP